MSGSNTVSNLFKRHKALFIVITIGIILLEVQIFAFATMKAGRKSILQIRDHQGNLIHVTDGENLSTFNKYYFEETFGPMDQYQVRLVTRDQPFPFRAWFTAALGIPIGAVLLFGFIFRAYLTFVHGKTPPKPSDSPPADATAPQTRLQNIINQTSRMNIFMVGILVFLAVLAYWIVPNAVTYLGKMGLDTVIRYKWIFLPIVTVLVGIVIWIIYLRYLLVKKSIESQVQLNKYRLQLEMASNGGKPLELDYTPGQNEGGHSAALTEEEVTRTKKKNDPNGSNHRRDQEPNA